MSNKVPAVSQSWEKMTGRHMLFSSLVVAVVVSGGDINRQKETAKPPSPEVRMSCDLQRGG